VSFDYKDHRDGKIKRMRMPVMQFIARMLWHAPPKGQHVTRHAGLYGTARIEQYGAALRALMDKEPALWPKATAAMGDPPPLPPEAPRCPRCRVTLLRRLQPRTAHQSSEISLAAAVRKRTRAPPAVPGRCPTPRSTATRSGMPPWRREREDDDRPRRQGGMPLRAR
jgi:hypothetical protein